MDGLFHSFGKETISDDDDVENYDNVDKPTNKTDRDNMSIFDRYSDASDYKNYRGRASYCVVNEIISSFYLLIVILFKNR